MTDLLLTYKMPEKDGAAFINLVGGMAELVGTECGGKLETSPDSTNRKPKTRRSPTNKRFYGETLVKIKMPKSWESKAMEGTNFYSLCEALWVRNGETLKYGVIQTIARDIYGIPKTTGASQVKNKGWIKEVKDG